MDVCQTRRIALQAKTAQSAVPKSPKFTVPSPMLNCSLVPLLPAQPRNKRRAELGISVPRLDQPPSVSRLIPRSGWVRGIYAAR